VFEVTYGGKAEVWWQLPLMCVDRSAAHTLLSCNRRAD